VIGNSPIKTRTLQYDLPPELIAQQPVEPRDASRLLVLDRRSGAIEHRVFRDLPGYLRAGDGLVLNTTRVLPARFAARRATGGRIEGLFLAESGPGRWRVLLRGVGRTRADEPLLLEGGWTMRVVARGERGECDVAVEPPDGAASILEQIGDAPLPPYIRRAWEQLEPMRRADLARYQTIYASVPGAVAAPTAGMHFTAELVDAVRAAGVGMAEVVLHVGLGTFQPVEVEDLGDHKMHREWYALPAAAADRLNTTRERSGRIVAVGTTSVRVLESCGDMEHLGARSGWTDLLIYPPYSFAWTDVLLTNFHLPGSTLLALVCAFAGYEQMMAAYAEAVRERYRFYSYGDAMLIV